MNIFETTVEHFHHHDQERTLTPQQPAQPARLVDSLHAVTGEIQSNPLVARLLDHGLGKLLTVPEANSIATIIAGIEQPRRTAAQAQQHDDAQQHNDAQQGHA